MNSALREQIAAFDPELPLERAHTIPARWYFDLDLADLERRWIFGDSWLAVERLSLLAQPGSFVTAYIAGEPILVVRDEAGVLRAFYNVCRHRAAPLLNETCGQVNKLRCRYHGWTYDLAGRLRGTPEFDGVCDFRREDNGLVPLALAEWGPYVWVHAGRQQPPLTDFLAPLIERTSGRGLDLLRWVERRTYDLACNWKVFVDNYLDGGYHVNYVHPGLAGVLDYNQYHSVIAGETSVQLSPLKPAQGDPTVAGVRTGTEAQYWWLFPNLMVNLYEGVMDTNLVLPLAVDRCRVIFDFYFADVDGPAAQAFMRQSIEVAEQVQQEDMSICAEVQRGLGSRSFEAGRFSVRREGPGYHFHQLLARRLKRALAEPGLCGSVF